MFCLDYAIAFFSHYWLSKMQKKANTLAETQQKQQQSNNGFIHFAIGATSGLAAAVVLYPFDFVRMTTTTASGSHFAFSTIPYMSFYMGIYFSRPTEPEETQPLATKVVWAVAAAAAASAIELPFDKSKHEMLGSLRNAGLAAALRVPFGALLLLGYDQILESGMHKNSTNPH